MNSNIWKIEWDIDELYRMFFADKAYTESEAMIYDYRDKDHYIDDQEAEDLLKYNEKKYEREVEYKQYTETLYG